MRRFFVLPLALVASASACHSNAAPSPVSAGSSSVERLRTAIDSMADAPQFSNAHWGILIIDPESGDTLYSRNAGKLFMPASNMKILTTATALTQLGADFRFRTSFAARGTISNGTLDGDLLVIGRGDPSVSDHMMHDAMLPLRAIADSISARGVKHITGRVLPAGDAFPGATLGYGWSYDDFQDSYSAPIDELLFNEGFSVIHVRGGERPGDPVQVAVSPARSFPKVRVLASTTVLAHDVPHRTDGGLRVRYDSTTWDVILEGQIAPRDTASLEITHHDPDVAYAAALREALRDRGIVVDEETINPGSRVDTLATLTSPTLREILPPLLKPSQNQIAEMLFRAVALNATGAGRADSATAVVSRQIAAWGVPANEAVVRDGSGLSRYDYVSPRTVARVLDAMRRSSSFAAFYDGLPIGGVDGTIRNRMKGTPAANNVHAKTGTLAMARSLSGYVTTADGRMLIFSLLCNNWTVPTREVERVQDEIVVRLAAMRIH
ncbi:MAG: D-alanyl-D-alanine carboxypeptidase/D-alanyl-D-alanine-endopeptidase [Gemmatimonadaceae bacterium]